MIEVLMAGFATLLVLYFAGRGKRKNINRTEGAILLIIYIGYIIYLLSR